MKIKKYIFPLTILATLTLGLTGCGEEPGIDYDPLEINEINDNYRSIYQIMPYSYADSNGDGIGDLNGIKAKVDYIASLNYTGIWLTPVHPSETYHKYDVDNYREIDEDFGTLADYDALVSKLHDNNMTMIMDLVINHSSDDNQWFKKCKNAHKNKQTTNQYYNYYNFIELTSGQDIPSGYTKLTDANLAYEARFWSGMPDLNLQNVLDEPDGYLATEIKDVLKFWLVDHKVDGFRLDAVTSYFTGEEDKTIEFLTWLNTECKKLKPTCYIVGEGDWAKGSPLNQRYQTSGIDSFFMFANSYAGGYLDSIVMGDASFYPYALRKNKEIANGGIEAPFTSNHDLGHFIGMVKGRSNLGNLKFGHGCLAMLNGTTFTYYGDEMGLAVPSNGTGEEIKDEDKRLPIDWGDSYTAKPVPGSAPFTKKQAYPYGSVKDQLKDKNSCVNYVKKANLLRKQLPQLARGTFETVYTERDDTLVAVKKTYNGESIIVVINASLAGAKTISMTSLGATKPIAELCASGKCSQDGDNIKIPKQGILILK